MQSWEENNIEKYFVKPILHEVFRDDRFARQEREYSIEKILNFDDDVLVIGAPGSGKTTLLKYIEYILKESKHYKPKFISLREIVNSNVDRIENSEKEKKMVFLLDGLDEVPHNLRGEARRQIEALQQRFLEAHFIISSRLIASHEVSSFKDFIVLRISELSDAQLADLFRIHGIEDWKRAYSAIQSSVALRRIIRNPFMAKLAIQYFDVIQSNDYIVDPTLYIDRLISDYVYKTAQSVGISESVIGRLLQEIAALLHYKEAHQFSVRDLHELAHHFIDYHLYRFDVHAFIDEMEHGYIFREVAPGLYSFTHISIFEHFLTKHLRQLVGYRSNKIILDTSQSVITAIKLKGFHKREALRKVFFDIERNFGFSSSQVSPIYAREGSIEILLAIAIGGATIHAFKKFTDGYFTKLGHITAEKTSSNKQQIVLPKEITDSLPIWIRDNEDAMKVFTNELILQHARNRIKDDKVTVSIAINSVLATQYGDCFEVISLSQFNEIPTLDIDDQSKKEKG